MRIKMAQSLYFNGEHCILALPKSIYQQWLLVITGMRLALAQFGTVASKITLWLFPATEM